MHLSTINRGSRKRVQPARGGYPIYKSGPAANSPPMNNGSQFYRRSPVTTLSISRLAAFGADQPITPIGHGRFGAVPSSHLGEHRRCDLLSGIGLNLMPASLAPNDQPDACGGSVAERHRRAAIGSHSEVNSTLSLSSFHSTIS
jgi:hypothetical protein